MDLESRTAFVTNIGNFISDAEDSITKVLDTLGWSSEQIENKQQQNIVTCPLNQHHRMPSSSLAKHLETCSWASEGYSREDMETAVPSSEFFYQDATTVHSVIIDKPLLNQILKSASQQRGGQSSVEPDTSPPERLVPRTANRAMADFTPDERWAIYDYVVAQGRASNKVQNITTEELQLSLERREEPFKQKSQLEILAEQRDYKRRRQSYRAKNVHITKKSYTEVMKEVIENHMQILLEKSTGVTDVASSPEPEEHSTSRVGSDRNSTAEASFDRAEQRRVSCDKADKSRRVFSERTDKPLRVSSERADKPRWISPERADKPRRVSPKREDETHRELERRSRQSEDRSGRRRRERSHDDSIRSHKRCHSPSSERSEDRSSKSDRKRHRDASSHHHHHKKSSHKSHKRHHHHRSPSRD